MINISRKDLLTVLKWSKANSPVIYLIFSMNGKWGGEKDNPANIVSTFAQLWPTTRAYLQTAALMNYKDGGRLRPSELDIDYPNPKIKSLILRDFFDLMMSIPKYMDEVEDFPFMEGFCRDMLQLFVWNSATRDVFRGTILYALDKQEKEEEAWDRFAEWKSEKTASLYSLAVLDRVDTIRAERILEPFRENAEDKALRGRIELLDRLKEARGEM